MELMRITGKSSFVKVDLKIRYPVSPSLATASEPDNHCKDV